MRSSTFWDITPCGLLKDNVRFGGRCHLHPQFRLASNWVHGVIYQKRELSLSSMLSRILFLGIHYAFVLSYLQPTWMQANPGMWATFTADFRPALVTCSANAKPDLRIWNCVGGSKTVRLKRKFTRLSILTASRKMFRHAFAKIYSNTVNFPWEILSNYMTEFIKPTREIIWTCFYLQLYRAVRNNYEKHLLTLLRLFVCPYVRQCLRESHNSSLKIIHTCIMITVPLLWWMFCLLIKYSTTSLP
jgi:hypothetical protein